MTTLRRVLLQSAKEAGPTDASATAPTSKPTTPHSGKSTPRRPSPPLSASDTESLDNDEAKASEKKTHLNKRRRTSRGWEEANGDIKSPKSTKDEPPQRSPRLTMARSSSSSSITSSAALLKSPKTALPPPQSLSVVDKATKSSLKGEKALPTVPEEEIVVVASKVVEAPSTLSEIFSETITTVSEPAVEVAVVLSPAQEEVVAETSKPKRVRSTSPPSAPPLILKDLPKDRQHSTGSSTSSSSVPTRQQTSVKQHTVTHAVIAQEWVQCEDCRKWRKLPLNIAAASLPDSWFCHMNTWNTTLASCTASVEEGSEETTEEAPSNSVAAKVGQVQPSTVPITTQRTGRLPPGINLYGGQVQAPLAAVGQPGAKQARFSTYRDLIGAHYRSNKQFIATFEPTLDLRYESFRTYTSPALKPREFDCQHQLLAFPRLGFAQPNGHHPVNGKANTEGPLPPKLLFKAMAAKQQAH